MAVGGAGGGGALWVTFVFGRREVQQRQVD